MTLLTLPQDAADMEQELTEPLTPRSGGMVPIMAQVLAFKSGFLEQKERRLREVLRGGKEIYTSKLNKVLNSI